MTNHIDLGTVLRQTLSANLYSNLVTRPTGRAVRTQIELLLRASERSLTVIDFSHVSMIDFSCADEVIAKLLMRDSRERESYFVFRGMTEDHWDAIETVLERHGLALVVEREDGMHLVGVLDDRERRAFDALKRRGRASCDEVALELGESLRETRDALDAMWRRRLIMRQDDAYMPVGSGEPA
jgi:anti-anti-sigma regulatory factor